MSKVFISYSREDKAFVLRLHDALVAQAFEVWVDWEDIPSSADWWQEICTGIDAADGVISVISPSYLTSVNCNREIDHALESRKRMVPIVFRDVTPADVRPDLSALNWIFVRETDDFAHAIETVIHALQTDLDYVRAHTRLLVRALEWEQKQRNTSFVLRGNDLREAESWLAQAVEKQPSPTPLQIQYIAASRRAATARQRVTIGALSLALIVTLILTIIAVVNGNRAQSNFLASENHRLAIAASAALQVDNFDLATLLGIRALRTTSSEDADLALSQSIGQTAGIAFRGHTGEIKSVAYSFDGQYALTGSLDGTARLWQIATGQEVRRFVIGGFVEAVAFSPDDRYALIGGGGTAQLWDLATGEKARDFVGDMGDVLSVAYSPDGRYVLTGSDDRSAQLWDAATGQHLRTFDAPPDYEDATISSVAFSADSHYALTARGYYRDRYDGSVHVWDVETGQLLRELPGQGAALLSVAYAPVGFASVLTSDEKGQARLWDWNTQQTTWVFSGNQNQTIHAILSPDARFVLTAGDGILWEADSGKELRTLTEDGSPVQYAAFSPDSRYVFGSIGDHARLWDLQTGPELRRVTSSADPDAHATFSPDGQTILIVENDHRVHLLDTAALTEKQSFPSTGAFDARFSPDGQWVYSLSAAGQDSGSSYALERWDVAHGGSPLPIATFPTGILQQLTLSPDGRSMLLVEGGPMKAAELWSLGGAGLVRIFNNVHSALAYAATVGDTRVIAYLPDGRTIVTGSEQGVMTFWDVASGAEIRHFETGRGAEITALAVSADGRRIASGDQTGSVSLWDAATGTQQLHLSAHPGWVTSAAFSPDGHTLLTASGSATPLDDHLILWDAQSGAELQFFSGAQAVEGSVSFSPDGHYALTTGLDGSVRLWPLGNDALLALACSRISHDFSAAERVTYGLDDSPTCPAFGIPVPVKVEAPALTAPTAQATNTDLAPMSSASLTPMVITAQATPAEADAIPAASATPSLIPVTLAWSPIFSSPVPSLEPLATPTDVGFG